MGRRSEPGPRPAQGEPEAAQKECIYYFGCSLEDHVGVRPLEREGAHPGERRRRRGRFFFAGDDERARRTRDGELPHRTSSGHGRLQRRRDVRARSPQVRHGQGTEPSQARHGEQQADGAGDGLRVAEPRLGRREAQSIFAVLFPCAKHARSGADLDGVPERGTRAVHLERHDSVGVAALFVLLPPPRRGGGGSAERRAHHCGLSRTRGGGQRRRAAVLVDGRRGYEGQRRRRDRSRGRRGRRS